VVKRWIAQRVREGLLSSVAALPLDASQRPVTGAKPSPDQKIAYDCKGSIVRIREAR
jgi:hypothetical protein